MSSVTDVVVWRLTADDWQVFRDVRLASLRESPKAFSATLDGALARDEAAWRDGLAPPRQSPVLGSVHTTDSEVAWGAEVCTPP